MPVTESADPAAFYPPVSLSPAQRPPTPTPVAREERPKCTKRNTMLAANLADAPHDDIYV